MVRQPATACPNDCQTTAPSLLLRLQQSLWHWTFTDMCPDHHDVVVYSDSMSCWQASMSCWQAIEGGDTENPFVCHIMSLLWLLSDKGTHVHLCCIQSHCGIEGNERVDQLGKDTVNHDIDPRRRLICLWGHVSFGQMQSNPIHWSTPTLSSWFKSWQRPPSRETNTGANEEIPTLNHSWRGWGCNHLTLSWPYQGHQVPYLVPRTSGCLSPLWSNTDHNAPEVCSVTDLHSGIPARSGILLSDMNGRTFYTIPLLNPLRDNSRDLHSGIPVRSGILLSDMTQLTSTSPQTWTI